MKSVVLLGSLLVLLLDGAVALSSLVDVTHQALSLVPYFVENLHREESSKTVNLVPSTSPAHSSALGSTPAALGSETDDETLLRRYVENLRPRRLCDIQGDSNSPLAFAAVYNSEDWRDNLQCSLGVARIIILYQRKLGDVDLEEVSSAIRGHHYSLTFVIEEVQQQGERSFILHRHSSLSQESCSDALTLCQSSRVLIFLETSLAVSVDDANLSASNAESLHKDTLADQIASPLERLEGQDFASLHSQRSHVDDSREVPNSPHEDIQNLQVSALNYPRQDDGDDVEQESSSYELESIPGISNDNRQLTSSNELSSQGDDVSLEGPFPRGPADSPYVPPPPLRALHEDGRRVARRLIFDDMETPQDSAAAGGNIASESRVAPPPTHNPQREPRSPSNPRRTLRFDGNDEDCEISEIQYSDSDSEEVPPLASLATPRPRNTVDRQSNMRRNDRDNAVSPGLSRQVGVLEGELVVLVTNDTTGEVEGIVRSQPDLVVRMRLPESANQEEANETGRNSILTRGSTPILYFVAIPAVSMLFFWSLWNLAKTFIQ